jgi:hypothetical protein
LEKIPYKTDKKVIIIFLDDTEDGIWEDAVAEDFMKGYSEKNTAEVAKFFADELGAGEWACLAGLWHDVEKDRG